MRGLLFIVCMLAVANVQAQVRITGVVVDSLGNAIPKVTIKEAGKAYLGTSDGKGQFEIHTQSNSGVLHFRHIGYDEGMRFFNGDTVAMVVVLHAALSQIEEVKISTGYQTLPKDRATGSFEYIDNVALRGRATTNILERLEGIAPSIQFDKRDGNTNINIRGLNSFNQTMQGPLIVVDNFPFEGNIGAINPNDVASVTILKDAAAASIWGARAGNGVIVITTKAGKMGSKAEVSVTSNSTFVEKPNLAYRQRMGSSDFIDVEMMLFEKGFYDATLASPQIWSVVTTPVVDIMDQNAKGLVSDAKMKQAIDSWRKQDYIDELLQQRYRTAHNRQHSVSISGGTDNGRYYFSVGHDKTQASQHGNEGKRYTLRSNSSFHLWKGVEVSPTLSYSYADRDGKMVNELGLYPYARLIGDDGSFLPVPHQYNLRYITTQVDDRLLDWTYNPIQDANTGLSQSAISHLQGGIGVKWRGLNDRLEVHALYNHEYQQSQSDMEESLDSYFTRNLINRFTLINSNGSLTYGVPLGAIRSTTANSTTGNRGRLQLSFNESFNDHGLTFLAGAEASDRLTISDAYRLYGFDSKTWVHTNVNLSETLPTYKNLFGSQLIPSLGGKDKNVFRMVSFYLNWSYQYKNRYVFSFSARRDASNTYGVKANDRWNPLWSMGVSWTVSEEKFMQGVDGLDYLKLRATTGHSGNSGGLANTLPIISIQNSVVNYSTLPWALITTLPNPRSKWEDVRMRNVGVDFAIRNNIIEGSFEWYDKKSTDLISEDALDPTTGFSSIRRNVAEMSGQGIDIKLNTNFKAGNLAVRLATGFSRSTNMIDRFYGTLAATDYYTGAGGKLMNPLQDRSLYPVFSYRFEGLSAEEGDPIGIMEGEKSTDYAALIKDSLYNTTYHGTGLAPNYGFFSPKVSWKAFDLSLNFMYKFGAFFLKETIRYNALFNNGQSHRDYEKRWRNPGDEARTKVPSMVYPANSARDVFYAQSEANVRRSDLIRLNDVKVSYNFNVSRIGNIEGQLYAMANNIALLWTHNKDGIDPDFTYMPQAANYSLGLSVKFK